MKKTKKNNAPKILWAEVEITCPKCKPGSISFYISYGIGNTESYCDNCERRFQTHLEINMETVNEVSE